jgi:hypothetical protein
MSSDYSIHFHVWDRPALLDFFLQLRSALAFPFEIELFCALGEESVLVIRKTNEPLIAGPASAK